MPSRLLIAVFCSAFATGVWAADPVQSTRNTDLDKAAVEVLKDLHNRGADLYNSADAAGAFRLYDTALRAIGPFLAHRPKVQATIADGLAEAAKLEGAKTQAYRLHELIDQVRNDLKTAIKADAEAPPPPEPKPAEAKTDPKPGELKTEPKGGEPAPEPKPAEKKPDPKPGDPKSESKTGEPEPKPAEKKVDPKPGDKKSEMKPEPKPEPLEVGALTGTLTLDGKPLPDTTFMLVSFSLPKPHSVTTTSQKDGAFSFAALPPATYTVVMASGAKSLQVKGPLTVTSGGILVVKAGPQTASINLQSK